MRIGPGRTMRVRDWASPVQSAIPQSRRRYRQGGFDAKVSLRCGLWNSRRGPRCSPARSSEPGAPPTGSHKIKQRPPSTFTGTPSPTPNETRTPASAPPWPRRCDSRGRYRREVGAGHHGANGPPLRRDGAALHPRRQRVHRECRGRVAMSSVGGNARGDAVRCS